MGRREVVAVALDLLSQLAGQLAEVRSGPLNQRAAGRAVVRGASAGELLHEGAGRLGAVGLFEAAHALASVQGNVHHAHLLPGPRALAGLGHVVGETHLAA